ncbi:MAG: hypothetical protein LRY27_00465 [Chitinophagales bacterium]|nr:hypothetical protein [Chitinophagales bacterium]
MLLKKASAWYDHEFGRHRETKNKKNNPTANKDVAWNWISSQLNNGYEFTAYDLINLKIKKNWVRI